MQTITEAQGSKREHPGPDGFADMEKTEEVDHSQMLTPRPENDPAMTLADAKAFTDVWLAPGLVPGENERADTPDLWRAGPARSPEREYHSNRERFVSRREHAFSSGDFT